MLVMAVVGVDMKEVYELSGYLKSMDSRLKALQAASDKISVSVTDLSSGVNTKRDELKKEVADIAADISSLKDDVRALQSSILQMISQLKSSVKTDEFDRFKKRIDLWAPESFVTRREVKKIID